MQGTIIRDILVSDNTTAKFAKETSGGVYVYNLHTGKNAIVTVEGDSNIPVAEMHIQNKSLLQVSSDPGNV